LTGGLLAWAIVLWQRGAATTGDVVLVCTLGLSVLHATRDLAVALVDVTQHIARLSEALSTLLAPHQLRDHPEAVSLVKHGTSIAFENISFRFPSSQRVFENLSLRRRQQKLVQSNRCKTGPGKAVAGRPVASVA
jgi:ATP-binding cassette, subfamily B, bacterial